MWISSSKCCFVDIEICGITTLVLYAIRTLILIGLNCYMMMFSSEYATELSKEDYNGASFGDIRNRFIGVCLINVALNCGLFLSSLLGIIGILKFQHTYFIPWLALWLCNFVSLMLIQILLLGITNKAPLKGLKNVGGIVGITFLICFELFAAAVIIRLYKVVFDEDKILNDF